MRLLPVAESGDREAFVSWFLLNTAATRGGLVPLSWVADLVGVSRAAVHRRVKAGKLDVLRFRVQPESGTREPMQVEYKLVRMADVSRWRAHR